MTVLVRTRLALAVSSFLMAILAGVRPGASQQADYSGGVWPVAAPTSYETLAIGAPRGLLSAEQDGPKRLPATAGISDGASQLMDSPIDTISYEAMGDSESAPKPLEFNAGSVKVVPYGILWGDMIYATSRTFPGHFILWIESEQTQGEPTFVIDARRSRIGANIVGPTVDVLGGLKQGGRVEVDFFGGFVIENTTDVRLRHVYWEGKNDNVRMLIGQTWDLISPLYPNTVSFPVAWATGNIGFRRTQFRLERYLHVSDNVMWTVQGALAQNIVPDLASGPLAADVNRETGNWPMIQGRTAITFPGLGGHCRPVTIGVSGHIGETGFDFREESPGPANLPPEDDARIQTWSFNVDVKMPITERLGFHGEFFTGANLSNELGGIVQGVCPCLRAPIRATGGWGELAYDLTPDVHAHVGFGIDDPNDRDSLIGRTYNRTIWANVMLDLTEHWKTGFEVSARRTHYHNLTLDEPEEDRLAGPTEPGEATVLDWTVRYKF